MSRGELEGAVIFGSRRILAGLAAAAVVLAGCSVGGGPEGRAVASSSACPTAPARPRRGRASSRRHPTRARPRGASGVFVDGAAFAGTGANRRQRRPGRRRRQGVGRPDPLHHQRGGARRARLRAVARLDARPGEDLLHTRADSLHLLWRQPGTGQGRCSGSPRQLGRHPRPRRGSSTTPLALGGRTSWPPPCAT